MQRILWRLAAASGVAVSLAFTAGPAGAVSGDSWHRPEPTAVQYADQSARTHQDADSYAKSEQFLPINANVPVQILGFGHNGGDTKQSNNSSAKSSAENKAWTGQFVDQHQKVEHPKGHDDHKGGYDRPKGHDDHKGGHDRPKGHDDHKGGHDRAKGHDDHKGGYDDHKGGYGHPNGGPAYQWADQDAETEQDAESHAKSKQILPLNVNVPFQALSFGHNGGDTKQSNNSSAKSSAENKAWTGQFVDQHQKVEHPKGHDDHKGGYDDYKGGYDRPKSGPAFQWAQQDAETKQYADSSAESKQFLPINANVPVQILGFGKNGGDTYQSNNSTAKSSAENEAWTGQSVDQDQHSKGGWSSGPAFQGAEQDAETKQDAESHATSKQIAPINVNAPIQVLSFGKNGGDTYQSNNSTAKSSAENEAWTGQQADQNQHRGSGSAFQGAEQDAETNQYADSSAKSEQFLPVNANVPVQILSFGHNGGDTAQSNNSAAQSSAENEAGTGQSIGQAQGLGGLLG